MRFSGRQLLLIASVWAAFGWLHGTQLYIGIRGEKLGAHFSYGRIVLWQIGCWLLWAALTPFVIWFSRRVPLSLHVRPIVAHVLVGALIPLVRVVGLDFVSSLAEPFGPRADRAFSDRYAGLLSSYFHLDFLVYWAIVGVVHAVDSRQRLREREIHASRVEGQLAQAQLANLRLQLQPHFLFNTLHAIASLVRSGDQQSAVRMIAGLSDLLRYSLDNAGRNVVSLSEELEVVQQYLDIQKTRFSDRLQVTIQRSEETNDAAVPTLLLQPIVENAIRHGIAVSSSMGRLEVRTRREDQSLVVEVFDDGPPLPSDWQKGEGIGLSSTRARLQQLYGAKASLELENQQPRGVVARIRIPFSRELSDV